MDMLLGLIFAFCCILVTSEQPEHFHLEVSASGVVQPGTSSPGSGSLVPLEGSWFRKSWRGRQQRRQQRKDLRKQRKQRREALRQQRKQERQQRKEERKQKQQQRKNMRKQRRQQAKQARQQKRKQKREQNRQRRQGLWKWLKRITAKQRQQMKQCKFASPIFRGICKFLQGHVVEAGKSLPESFCSRGDQTEWSGLAAFLAPAYVIDRTTELRCNLIGLLWEFVLKEHEAHLIGTRFVGFASFKTPFMSRIADASIGIWNAVIASGKIELSSPGTSRVLMRNTDAVASPTDILAPAQIILQAAVDLEGSLDIFDCFFLKDLTFTGAKLALARFKAARPDCMALSDSASLGATAVSSGSSKVGFAANLELEGAVDILQCVVLANVIIIDTQAVTFETDNSLDAGCVMTMQQATINAANEGLLAEATLRRVKLTGDVDIFGCSLLKSLMVQQGSIAVIKHSMTDGSKGSDCSMSLSGTAAIESTAGSSKMTFQSVDLEGSLDIFHCIFLQDLTITGAIIIVLHELDCTAIATNGALFGSAAVSSGSSKVRLTNVELKGEVDILECVVLKDVFVSGGVGVKDADTDCVFHADSASINAVDEYSSPRVFASSSLRLEGPVNIFNCTVLTGDVTITGGSISWKPDDETASGCVITGHEDASIEFLEESSLRFQNVRLSGSIDFGSCGYFQDVTITGLITLRPTTAHATYSCTVSGSKASITATGDKSRLDFESVRLEGDVAFGVCVTAASMQVDNSGYIRFRGCKSESCLFVEKNFILSNAAITFQDCEYRGMQASGDVTLKNGASMSFKDCGNLQVEGGGLLVVGGLHVENGSSLEAKSCVSRRGAGVHAEGGVESSGQLRFIDCWAEDAGGAFVSIGPAHVMGDVLIKRTSSYNRGACSLNRGGSFDGASIRFENLSGIAKPTFGPAAIDSISTDPLTIKDVSFGQHVSATGIIVKTEGPLKAEGVHFTADAQHYRFVAMKGLVLKDVDCDNVESCIFEVFEAISPNAEAASGSIPCRRGWGTPPSTTESHHIAGCAQCPPGRVQLQHGEQAECQVCPKRSIKCLPDTLTVPEGFYGTESAQVFACPNREACGGGILPFQNNFSMCEDGYFGEGCAQCAERHALSDASVLVCVQCAESSVARAFQVLAWLGKSALVFGIAGKSVLGSTGTAKASSIYLNQLLSFSTVASTVMSAMLQTPAAQELQETVARFLFQAASLIMDVGTGQAVGGGGQSVQCILQYIGLQPSVWKGQVAFAAVVATLTALMAAAKGPRVAVLVSINCFFPAFMGHFGRQLVCFRLRETQGLEGLHCPHVPSFPGGFALVLAVTVLAAAVILRVWWSLYGGVAVEEAKKEESEEAKIPVHVAFLTAPYQEAYAKWETERLLRKTTFTLLAAMLPVSASPSLQMSSLGLLLLGSLVMNGMLRPYKDARWNLVEVAQLTTCLAMMLTTTALLARDVHWGESKAVQGMIILFVTFLAAGISSVLLFRAIRALVEEHVAKAAASGLVQSV